MSTETKKKASKPEERVCYSEDRDREERVYKKEYTRKKRRKSIQSGKKANTYQFSMTD